MNTPPPPRPLNPVHDPIDIAVGTAINKVMKRQGVSVNALSNATGLTRQTITRSITGTRSLDFRQFDKISAALGGVHVDIVRDAAATIHGDESPPAA